MRCSMPAACLPKLLMAAAHLAPTETAATTAIFILLCKCIPVFFRSSSVDIFGAGHRRHGRHAREPGINLRQYIGATFYRRHEL